MVEDLQNKIWTPTPEFMEAEQRFIVSALTEIGTETIYNAIDVAAKYRKNAYVEYSHYQVGAAILTDGGSIYGACNSESVAYSPTNHAEGSAISSANNEGEGKKNRKYIKAVAVCHSGDSGRCGECLQRIVEHADNCW